MIRNEFGVIVIEGGMIIKKMRTIDWRSYLESSECVILINESTAKRRVRC
jgi:hypothetical protein